MIEDTLANIAVLLHGERPHTDTHFYGCSTDTRTLKPGNLYVALRGERFDGHDFIAAAAAQGAAALLTERAVETTLPYVRVPDCRRALGQLAAAWRARFSMPLVAVTGSNGKTTIKEMLRCIFASDAATVLATQGNLNNDIGVPLTLFELNAHHQYAVIEMGANHAGEIAQLSAIARPDVALISQCAPAHLEGFASIDGVAAAKGEIFSGLSERGFAIINQDDVYADYWRNLAQGHTLFSFGMIHDAHFMAYSLSLDRSNACQNFALHTPLGDIRLNLHLLGRHNVLNALAAAACAVAVGCDLEQIRHGLQAVRPVGGRLHLLPGMNNSHLIDDSYNANPGSMRAAIDVLADFPAPRWLVLGDMRELGAEAVRFHADIGAKAKAVGIEQLYALGELSRHSAAAFGGGYHFNTHAALIAQLRHDLNTHSGVYMLIKGSRGMKMEQIIQALK
jgi:UDP-N-acetylmuramoyl-tripeptide--D-alanyl-D-alanine ligase